MATLAQISAMGKAGNASQAILVAQNDIDQNPGADWPKTNMGWALYYAIKDEVDTRNTSMFFTHLDALVALGLSPTYDAMLLENVAYRIGGFVKNCTNSDNSSDIATLSTLFVKIHPITFNASEGFSFLMSMVLKHKTWGQLMDFIEWWGFDSFLQKDYVPFRLANGRDVMSLVERVHNAYTKCLLACRDIERVKNFIPRLEQLVDSHPEMQYPPYCYSKLLLYLNAPEQETLARALSFAKKKPNDYWVWEMLADIIKSDRKKRMACLLRAVDCCKDEKFLGKVRTKLALMYVEDRDYARAKHHISTVTECYASNGWGQPMDLRIYNNTQWINSVQPDKSAPIDYIAITNSILYGETLSAVAVVTYVNPANHRASFIYGVKQSASCKFRERVNTGDILDIHYVKENEDKIKVVGCKKIRLERGLEYVKIMKGDVQKRADKDFAFVVDGDNRLFVSPDIVRRNNICDKDSISCIAAYSFNKSKNQWNWVCVKVISRNR